ncbi:hypothetical protein [Vibrio sp. SCSIO 43137]|uniref:hypothetical protein n=1 Tax=Vibrio sp. SCSIO 43137 TaxID=3021011 RepID=UPI0023081BA8|nr:hypothetical protein [Vibrio sp. SCSIO 43137]WCE28429.1 hypothetical protein PK654_08575 [Vibrio sp. SCSIO 43137]
MSNVITRSSDPELFKTLADACDFDNDHVPKHGSGTVICRAEHEGKLYECEEVWDYSWGIDWTYSHAEWQEIPKDAPKCCPSCGQEMPNA